MGGVLGVFFGNLQFEQAGAQHGQSLRLVLQLGAFIRTAHGQAGGNVLDLHGGVGGVHALAALTRGAADADFQVVRINLHVHFLGFRQYGHGGGAGVDAALRLGGGHALDAMDAALVFQAFIHIGTRHEKYYFPETAQVGGIGIHGLHLPALRFGIAAVHAVEVGGKQGGFAATRAGADFHDGVAGIHGVRRHEAKHELLGEFLFLFGKPGDFLAGHGGQFGFRLFALEQYAVFLQIGHHFQIRAARRDQVLEAGVFAGEFLGVLRIVEYLGIAQQRFDLRKPLAEPLNMRAQIHDSLRMMNSAGAGPF